MLPATYCILARLDFGNEKTSFTPPTPDRGEIELRSNFENLQPIYLWKHAFYN